MQIVIVQYGGAFFQCTALTWQQNLFCVLVGVGALIFGILFRLIPVRVCACFHFHEEEKKAGGFTELVRKKTTRRAPTKHE